MHHRRSAGSWTERPLTRPARIALAAVVLMLAAGCNAGTVSAGHPSASGTPAGVAMTICGTTRTAANVPVNIEIAQGPVSCSTAMAVEQAYAQAIRSGKALGNGGGGPVQVKGWTCAGFPTPIVLKTGEASKCVNGKEEILAVLPVSA
jgi:hypothetical protein